MNNRDAAREQWLICLRKIYETAVGRQFLFELLRLLRYANSIDPQDAETCAYQNLARKLVGDLACANVGAAKHLHAQANGWEQGALDG